MIAALSLNQGLSPVYIKAVTSKEQALAGLSAQERSAYEQQDFKPGSWVKIVNNQGDVQEIRALVSLPIEWTDWGNLAASLPSGTYALDKENLSQDDQDKLYLGYVLGAYRFDSYVKKSPIQAKLQVDKINPLWTAIYTARDLINTPAADLGPQELASQAKNLESLGAEVKVISGQDLLKNSLPAIYAVGASSHRPPVLIDLRWSKQPGPKVTLIGKGICFDTGGLNIKPESGMLLMRKDMGGAALALGLAQAVISLQLPIQLRMLIPAADNAISSTAYRPGDIVQTRQGSSIEVGHTDAEGRVVLADALALAVEENPDYIIDFATLTGAARVAMGPDIPALFSNKDSLAREVQDLSWAKQDPLWHMPLYRPYKDLIKSSWADINNSAQGGYGGAITAALFLQHFLGDYQGSWLHMDLMAWNVQNSPGKPKGGEAQGLRTMLAFLQSL